MAKRRKPAPPNVLIGFDCEWQYDPKNDRNSVLSYQAHLINRDADVSYSFIRHILPNYREKYDRLTLAEFLVRVLLSARKAGAIASYPRLIILAGYFTRSDLCMFSDFHRFLKRRLAAVRGTYVTTERLLPINLPFPNGGRRVTVAVVDTMLLAPEKSSLATLGSHIGLPKIEIMSGYSIEDMARYRDEQREAFDAYALRDAEIAARYASSIFDLLKRLGIARRAPTLGAAGVALFKLLFSKKEDWLAFLAQDTGLNSEKRRQWRPASHVAALMQFAAGCFHGGLNTIFRVGYSPLGRSVLDVDLAGAYTTALAAIGYPNWETARYSKSLEDLAVVDAAMTFSQVKFRFPADVKFPCLPIRSAKQHGLIFPLQGESWCCGPELVVARAMGATIEVINGYRVDWLPDRANPFATFSRNIAEGRKAAKRSGNAMLELLFKLLGNTLYGKVSQGVSAKRPIADDIEDHRVFNAEAGEMTDLPPSSITCPAIASWATSLVRATMAEALHRLPPTTIALQATTDGILYVGAESDLDVSGPVAQAFRRARALVVGEPDPRIWETKHRLPRVLTFKTRGMISVVPEDWAEPIHLAKAGARLPDYLKTDVERTRYAEQLYRERDYDTKFERRELTSLSEQHRKGCDLTSKTMEVRLSWDFDWKNEPIEPVVDVEGVISFATSPWRTLEEFEKRREHFEDWKRNEHRVLRTARDYADMQGWPEMRRTRKALRTNSRGVLPNLARAIAAIIVRLPLRERPTYKQIAEILARAIGCFVTENHIKNIRAKRDQIPLQCVSQLSVTDIEFARLYGTNPIAVDRMRTSIIPGSIAERQFAEIWERRLPVPVLVIVNDRDDLPESASAAALVAVAGGHSAAHQVGRPDQMAESLRPVKPASLAERAALARIERVIEPAQDQPRTELTRLHQARIDKWIRNRVLVDWRDSCWRCRKPIIVGQPWLTIAGDGVLVRFHRDCHSEWRAEQEAAARKALGLA